MADENLTVQDLLRVAGEEDLAQPHLFDVMVERKVAHLRKGQERRLSLSCLAAKTDCNKSDDDACCMLVVVVVFRSILHTSSPCNVTNP